MGEKSWKLLAVSLFLLACTGGILLGFSGGPPLGSTGDFGEDSCNQPGCHSGNNLNAPGGTLTITGVPANYTPGNLYTITVTINRTNQRRWGFMLSARAVNTAAQAGTLIVTSQLNNQTGTQSGIQYITHTQ